MRQDRSAPCQETVKMARLSLGDPRQRVGVLDGLAGATFVTCEDRKKDEAHPSDQEGQRLRVHFSRPFSGSRFLCAGRRRCAAGGGGAPSCALGDAALPDATTIGPFRRTTPAAQRKPLREPTTPSAT